MSSRVIYLLGQALLVVGFGLWLTLTVAAVIYKSRDLAIFGCLGMGALTVLSMLLIPFYDWAWKQEMRRSRGGRH